MDPQDVATRARAARTVPAGFPQISPLGLGCWAIGGPLFRDGIACGYAHYDDAESLRAVRRALDLGVNLIDTADMYGAGHSERILGDALAGRRDEVVLSTKFGNVFDEATRQWFGERSDPEFVRSACEASLRRLRTDRIDVYFLHLWDFPPERFAEIEDTLEGLVRDGKIRWYGWSTDQPDLVRRFAAGEHAIAVQHNLNVLDDDLPGLPAGGTLPVTDEFDLLSLARTPLAMGLLSGKYDASSPRFGDDDVRGKSPAWVTYFTDGRPNPEFLARLQAVREILTSNGRTVAQGALAWIWARHPRPIPLVGFRTVEQVEQNVGAIERGPLTAEQMAEIDRLLGRATDGDGARHVPAMEVAR